MIPASRPIASLTVALVVCCAAASSALAISTSPGPLARSHAKLEGPNQCTKCHTEGRGVVDNKCLGCHKEANASKYHREQAKASAKPCAKCHRDHRGRDFRMIRWRPDARFNHAKTGFSLRGKHQNTPCASCHKRPGKWMGLQQQCSTCHTDPHKPTLGTDCAQCHTEKAFAPATKFDHNKAKFALRGQHKDVPCQDCHKAKGSKGVYRGVKFAACADCHSEPVEKHSRGGQCGDCHVVDGFAKVSRTNALKLHAQTRLPLLDSHKPPDSHKPIDCTKCHTKRKKLRSAKTFAARLRLFAGLDSACGSCHKEPHEGRLGTHCADCHKATKFGEVHGKFDHKKTGFALRGKHRRVKCGGCHAPSGDFEHRFRATEGNRCTDCHYDPHGKFKSVKGGDKCETCHTVRGFAPANFDLDSHKQTRFALRFAHRVVPCGQCHPQTERNDDFKREIAQLIGIDSRCLGCHGTPHDRQFEERTPPLECWVCHRETHFSDLTFDHQQSRFPLVGPHQNAKCSQCHTRPKTADSPASSAAATAPKAVRFTGTPTDCAKCHTDPHRGQFASAGPTKTCTDCHKVQARFVIPSFDHTTTRFAIDGRHQAVTCDQCHRKVPVDGGTAPSSTAVTLYRMGAMACESCHFNPHERGRK